jgi:DNA mismatch repair protein MutS2
VIATTHYGLLKEMADVDPRFENASVEFDPETLAPTYRLRMVVPGSSSATAVAARMGLRQDVLERAHRFLAREDRQLDRMLSELAAARTTLESEQREARRLREESETARAEYGRKLERLQARRDELYRTMRSDLDRSFREAHAEIAGVIRTLQRGGTAQAAAQAREQIQAIEARARDSEAQADLPTRAVEPATPVDWRFAKPGDAVQLPGETRGVLAALPDRRGRVAVRVGGARVMVPAERVGLAPAADGPTRSPGPRVTVSTAPAPPIAPHSTRGGDADAGRCDLRGLRVDEALDRLLSALDRAAAAGRARILIVHGLGTGALRRAVHAHLAASPYVARFTPESDGATIAELAEAPGGPIVTPG